MKNTVLMICYSKTGTTLEVANQLVSMTGWDLAMLTDVVPRRGLLGDLRCVVDALFKRHPPYRYDGPPPAQYDHVVLMSPIWMGRLAAPMRAFIKDAQATPAGRNHLPASVSAICLMASRGGFRAVGDMSDLLGHAPWPVAALEEREVLCGQTFDLLNVLAADVRHVLEDPNPDPVRRHWLSSREA